VLDCCFNIPIYGLNSQFDYITKTARAMLAKLFAFEHYLVPLFLWDYCISVFVSRTNVFKHFHQLQCIVIIGKRRNIDLTEE
jgi:hypothetical protein